MKYAKSMKGDAREGGWHDSLSPEAHLLEMYTPEQSAKQVSQAWARAMGEVTWSILNSVCAWVCMSVKVRDSELLYS